MLEYMLDTNICIYVIKNRPVALLWPFGGAEPLKGYMGIEGIAAEIRRMIAGRWYVVVMPTGASWGSTAAAGR